MARVVLVKAAQQTSQSRSRASSAAVLELFTSEIGLRNVQLKRRLLIRLGDLIAQLSTHSGNNSVVILLIKHSPPRIRRQLKLPRLRSSISLVLITRRVVSNHSLLSQSITNIIQVNGLRANYSASIQSGARSVRL